MMPLSRRINNFMVWWCRCWVVWTTLVLLTNIAVRDVFWATLDIVLIVVFLFQADRFRQWRDA